MSQPVYSQVWRVIVSSARPWLCGSVLAAGRSGGAVVHHKAPPLLGRAGAGCRMRRLYKPRTKWGTNCRAGPPCLGMLLVHAACPSITGASQHTHRLAWYAMVGSHGGCRSRHGMSRDSSLITRAALLQCSSFQNRKNMLLLDSTKTHFGTF